MSHIENIPKIQASFSGGGVVFSIDFQQSFSQEASKVTYKIVSTTGNYSTPTIGSSASISFDNFKFNGYIYSYELEESVSSGKVLSVTLVDKSVILDKLYVVVFRRGLFNVPGTKNTKNFEVKFEDGEAFYYLGVDSGGFPVVRRKEYTNASVPREYYEAATKVGDVIIVGSEIPSDQECELLDSSYTFNQLSSVANVPGLSSAPIDKSIPQTYEGTLRSVLNSWCQDFQCSFYWDYTSDQLRFINLGSGVFSLPSSTDSKIISKKTYESAEGLFNQVCCNYYAAPFNPRTETYSLSKTVYSTFTIYPYSPSFFINRKIEEEGGSSGSSSDEGLFGGGRSLNEFMRSAICGYVSPTLRKVYNFSILEKFGGQIGIKQWVRATNNAGVEEVFNALELDGYEAEVEEMRAFAGMSSNSDKGTEYFNVLIAALDTGLEDSWNTIEQDVLTDKVGNYYRCTYNVSRRSVFCSSRQIIKTSVTYEPEGNILNDQDAEDSSASKIAGRRIFQRGAPGPNISPNKALEELGLEEGSSSSSNGGGAPLGGLGGSSSGGSGGELAKKLSLCVPLEIDVKEGGAVNDILGSIGATLTDYNKVLICPTESVVSAQVGLRVSSSSGRNEKETTVQDIINEQQSGMDEECELDDPNEEACLSARDEIMKKQKEAAEGSQGSFQTKEPIAGLISNSSAYGANISTSGGSVRVLTSSDSGYKSYQTFSFDVEGLFVNNEAEQFVSKMSGSTSSSKNIIETRVFIENRTDKDSLSRENLTPSELETRRGYTQSQNLQRRVFSCAGFVASLPLSPSSGLESLAMSITDSGFEATYSYTTRPPLFGKQDFSVINSNSSAYRPASQVKYSQ